MSYRELHKKEIEQLESQGCSAPDWKAVQVMEPFHPERIKDVSFSGTVRLGVFDAKVAFAGGMEVKSGIYSSRVHNSTIGDNSLVSTVGYLANYEVAGNVVIDSVGMLYVEGKTNFGNGVEIDVLNEGGGRGLKIFDRLSSQTAYLSVLYRHDNKLQKKLSDMIDRYVSEQTSEKGTISEGCSILNSNRIRNVNFGPYATVQGASVLDEGTVGSCKDDPVTIGDGVIARHFIVLSGSKVDGSVILDKCFVGQGVKLGKQYSAENSAFFANCEGFHGEACSLFAGPYTVTHHKSTLMIAGLFSFYNAGSGTNQSNHMYKLGPLHQGILERGSKTGSFSYMLWPCRIGAFTAVIGKHYTNFDTSDLPFSYISEEEGKSVLTPAMNLLTVGTRRDSSKWPNRDRRQDPDKLDLIHFNLYSPYTVAKMVRGRNILLELKEKANKELEFVTYKGIAIRRLMLKTCAKYYDLGIRIFIGNCLSDYIEKLTNGSKLKGFIDSLVRIKEKANDEWVDMAGLLMTRKAMEDLVHTISSGEVTDLEKLGQKLKSLYDDYTENELAYCLKLIEQTYGISIESISRDNLIQIVSDWKANCVKLNNMILKDATKEYDQSAMIGFGIDGDEETKTRDFQAVRGTYENDKFVKSLQGDSRDIEKSATDIIEKIKNMN
ncbi:MAG: DUF4954 family protein [Spirochaetales bacterium]|nr:DUF4954 family protein [Spirochaetales bacterium]